MINALLSGLIRFATFILGVLMTPINNYIEQNIPELNSAFNLIADFFDTASTNLGWVRESFFIEPDVMGLIIITIGIRLTLPLLISGIKLVAKWWDTIIA